MVQQNKKYGTPLHLRRAISQFSAISDLEVYIFIIKVMLIKSYVHQSISNQLIGNFIEISYVTWFLKQCVQDNCFHTFASTITQLLPQHYKIHMNLHIRFLMCFLFPNCTCMGFFTNWWKTSYFYSVTIPQNSKIWWHGKHQFDLLCNTARKALMTCEKLMLHLTCIHKYTAWKVIGCI